VIRLLVIPFLALTSLLVACGSDGGGDSDASPTPREDKLRVVTTVAPITSLAENIGGTRIDLESVVPDGEDSHTFEPPSSLTSTIADADLIILNGLQLEAPFLQLAEANKREDAAILLLGDSTITPEEYQYSFSFPESAGKPNPHLWLDPVLAAEYATLIHDKLAELDPANAEYFDTNLAILSSELERLDQQIRIAVQTIPAANRKLLTYHDSWIYWAERYGFTVVDAVESLDFSEPSASALAEVIGEVNAVKPPAIFGSVEFPGEVMLRIAAESGAGYPADLWDDVLPGEPGEDVHSYIGMMVQNMYIIIPALGGDATPLERVKPGPVFQENEEEGQESPTTGD
jgi:ABC-type Zn uptake system ZnuABC Zn-binding protein ZnuA